ncbi:hypothetical protein EV1_018592 [Malus domestica]
MSSSRRLYEQQKKCWHNKKNCSISRKVEMKLSQWKRMMMTNIEGFRPHIPVLSWKLMQRSLFNKIMSAICNLDPYFV